MQMKSASPLPAIPADGWTLSELACALAPDLAAAAGIAPNCRVGQAGAIAAERDMEAYARFRFGPTMVERLRNAIRSPPPETPENRAANIAMEFLALRVCVFMAEGHALADGIDMSAPPTAPRVTIRPDHWLLVGLDLPIGRIIGLPGVVELLDVSVRAAPASAAKEQSDVERWMTQAWSDGRAGKRAFAIRDCMAATGATWRAAAAAWMALPNRPRRGRPPQES